ncbi:MAG: hypothetical protein ACLQG3_05210 [Terracidiphilus sp.]
MCVPIHQRDPKTRRMMVIANLSLVAAVLLLGFMRHHAGEHPWIDGFTGLFFGMSIGVNLFGIRRACRCRQSQSAS